MFAFYKRVWRHVQMLGLGSVPVGLMNEWTNEWGREYWWNDATGKNRSTGRLTCPTATSSKTHTHIPNGLAGVRTRHCVLCKLYSLFQLLISCPKVALNQWGFRMWTDDGGHALRYGTQVQARNLLAWRFRVGFVGRQWLCILIGCAGHSARTCVSSH